MKMSSRFIGVATLLAASTLGVRSSLALHLTEQAGQVFFQHREFGDGSCETGSDGRAQVALEGGAVIRLGANSVLHSEDADAAVNLKKGTAVFDFSKDRQALQLKQAGKLISVRSGVGFVRFAEGKDGEVLLVAALAKKVALTLDGRSLQLRSGQLFALDARGRSVVSHFNLAKVGASATLLNAFQTPLPAQTAIAREIKNFASLEKRGFVRPNNGLDTEQMLARSKVSDEHGGSLALAAPNLPSASLLTGLGVADASAFSGTSGVLASSRTVGDAGSLTVDGAMIAGDGALTKAGAGTLTLGSANTYSGGATLSQGTLTFGGGVINSANLLAPGPALSLTPNGGTGALSSGSGLGTTPTLTITPWNAAGVSLATVDSLGASGIPNSILVIGPIPIGGAPQPFTWPGANTPSGGVPFAPSLTLIDPPIPGGTATLPITFNNSGTITFAGGTVVAVGAPFVGSLAEPLAPTFVNHQIQTGVPPGGRDFAAP